jgi:hypothetical protein
MAYLATRIGALPQLEDEVLLEVSAGVAADEEGELDGQHVVIAADADDDAIAVVLDYPLEEAWSFRVPLPPEGHTVRSLVRAIRAIYREVYAEEAATTTIPEGRAAPNLLNRNRTDGTYRIWGHDLGDLFVEGMRIGYAASGVVVVPIIGS